MDWNELMSTLTEVASRSLPLQQDGKEGTGLDDQPATIILELPPGMTTVPAQATFQAIRSTGPARRIPSAVAKKSLCPYCHKEFNAAYLVQHIRIHTGEKPFICEFCNKAFRASIDWKNHRRVHTGERPYKCKTCSKTFKQNTNLLRHMIRHTGKKPFQCDICLKLFWSMWGMQTHRRAHMGEYSFACKRCGDRFITKGQLDRHNMLHDGKELFKCKICSRLFAKPRLLELHMLRHEGIASALCELCGQGYARRESLARHMKKMHGMEYIYSCEACGKPFMTEEDRFKHSIVHMEGTCPICGKMFRRKLNLKNHIMAHMEGTGLASIDEDEMERRRRKLLKSRGPLPLTGRRRGRPPKHYFEHTAMEDMKPAKTFKGRSEVKKAKVALRLHLQLLREMRKELRSVPIWKRRNIMVIHKLRGKLRLHQTKRKSYYKKILERLKATPPVHTASNPDRPETEDVFDQVESAVARLHNEAGLEDGGEEETISRPNLPLRTFERPKKPDNVTETNTARVLKKLVPLLPKKPSVSEKAVMTDSRCVMREQGIMTDIPWAKGGASVQAANDCDKVPLMINKTTLMLLGWPYKTVDETLKQVVRHLGHIPLEGPAIQVFCNQPPGMGRVYSCSANDENSANVMLSVQPMDENVLFVIPVIKNALG